MPMSNGGPTSDASSAAEAFSDPYQVELTRLRQRDQRWRIDLTSINRDFASGSALMMLTDDLSDLAEMKFGRHPSNG
jgi:hypothetical protein